MAKITWDDIASLDGDSPLKKISEQIQQITIDLQNMSAAVQANSSKLDKELQDTQKESAALAQTVKALNVELESSGKVLQMASEKSAQFNASAVATKAVIADNDKATKALNDQIEKLNDTKAKAQKLAEEEAGSLNDIKAKLKAAEDGYKSMGTAVDASVKKQALDNIKELSKQHETANRILTDTKKGVDVAAGSYNELSRRVAEATKQLKGMADGASQNGVEFKKLQKEVLEGTNQLKAFDKGIGDSRREVGGYQEAIEKALGSLAKVSPELAEVGEASVSKFSLLTKLVSGYFIAAAAAVFAVFEVGKHALDTFFEGTAEGAGKAKLFSAEWKAAQEIIREGFVDLGRAITDFFGGLDRTTGQGFLSAAAAYLGLIDLSIKLRDKTKEQIELDKLNKAVKIEEIELIVKGTALELEKQKELFEARDKIRNQDQDRFEALIKANKAIEEKEELETEAAKKEIEVQRLNLKYLGFELAEGQKALDLLHDNNALQKINRSEREGVNGSIEQLAKAEAKLDQIEIERLSSSRRRQALEREIIDNSVKRTLDSAKLLQDAYTKQYTTQVQESLIANNKIVGNQAFSLNEQLKAQKEATNNLVQIERYALQKQLFDAEQSSFDRVHISRDAADEIIKKAAGDVNTLANLEIEEKRKILKTNYEFQQQSAAIVAESEQKEAGIIRSGTAAKTKIITDAYTYDISVQKAAAKQQTETDLLALNDRLEAGEITLRRFNMEKAIIVRRGAVEQASIQLDEQIEELERLREFYKTKKALASGDAEAINAIEAALSAARLQRSNETIKTEEDALAFRHQKIMEFQAGALASTQQFVDNQFAATQQGIQVELNALSAKHDRDIELAGDNADTKKRIDQQYAKDKAALDAKGLENRKKQAKFDKEIAEFQVVIKTAEAIADAEPYLAPPLTAIGLGAIALITATGLAQIAAIESRPLPQYFKGTTYSERGLAYVAEYGPELAITPGGKPKLYDTPQVANLELGTRIFTARETEQIIAGENMRVYGNSDIKKDSRLAPINIDFDSEGIKEEIRKGRVDYARHNYTLMKTMREGENFSRTMRDATQGYK